MGEILLRHVFYGLVAFMIIIIGGMSLMYDLNDEGNYFTNDGRFYTFERSFNSTENLLSEVDKLEASVNTEPKWGIFGALNALIETGWQTLKTSFSAVNFVSSMFLGLGMFYVPGWLSTLIFSFITILIVFIIYSAIFQRDI